MVALVKAGKCPAWALFCYKDLSTAADPEYIPRNPAFIADGAMLLHPMKVQDGYKGFLIATEAASGRKMVFRDIDGNAVTLSVPTVHTKVIAEEDAVLLS